MDTQKLLNYMDNLRADRKMSQETYLFDIISQRQYYRYRKGQAEIPFDVLNKLANKLDIPLLKIISSFQANAIAEKEIVNDLYKLVVRKQLSQAKLVFDKYDDFHFINSETQLIYFLSKVFYRFYRGEINTLDMIDILKDKIEYDQTMKKKILHDIEVYYLGVIMQHSNKDRNKILNKINQLRKANKLLLGGNTLLHSQIYFWILKNLGRSSRFEELLEVADIAIEEAKRNYSYHSLEYFYYYKALALMRTDQHLAFEEALTKTIYTLFLVDEFKRNKFFETIEKDTNIKVQEFIIDKIKKEFQ
ncbi:MAG: hypothetical protein ACLFPM_04735 [Candidatus Izemoplasmatales bacterium]